MKHWISLLFLFGTVPWCLRAALPPHFQEKIDYYINPSASRWLAILSILVAFILANILAWKDQYDKITNLEKTNNELQVKLVKLTDITKPNLIGHIDAWIIGSMEHKAAHIMILLSISNSGAPSIAEEWTLSIDNDKIHISGIIPTIITDDLILYRGSWKEQEILAKFNQSDAIYDKALVPILKGARLRGWLRFEVNQVQYKDIIPGTNLTIHFKDYLNTSYSANTIVKNGGKMPLYFPGTRYPFEPFPKK